MATLKQSPLIVHIDWVRDHKDAFYDRERRLFKAALLYADTVELQSLAWTRLLASAIVPHLSEKPDLDPARWFDLQLSMLLTKGELSDRPVPDDSDEAVLGLKEIIQAIKSGALIYPDLDIDGQRKDKKDGPWTNLDAIVALSDASHKRMEEPDVLPFYDRVTDPRWQPSPGAWEGALAVSLLGGLEAFPNATMDVILDVRERLLESRAYMRAALAEAANELTEAEESPERLPAVLQDLRIRVIDPALEAINEDVQALGARDTLARVASDPRFVTAASGWLSIGAASGAGLAKLGALATAAPIAPAIAAAAKEYRERQTLKSDLRQRPYWMLHAANDQLHRLP